MNYHQCVCDFNFLKLPTLPKLKTDYQFYQNLLVNYHQKPNKIILKQSDTDMSDCEWFLYDGTHGVLARKPLVVLSPETLYVPVSFLHKTIHCQIVSGHWLINKKNINTLNVGCWSIVGELKAEQTMTLCRELLQNRTQQCCTTNLAIVFYISNFWKLW